MTTHHELWIGQNGKRYGPYTEAMVRQWQSGGKLDADALAWREGMPEWVLLSDLFPAAAGHQQRPPLPTSDGIYHASYATEPFAARNAAADGHAESDPADLPTPPSLHWGLVLLFTMLSFGLFGIVWSFIQAGWIYKIDRRSNGRLLLILSLIAFFVGEALSISSSFAVHAGHPGMAGIVGIIGVLLVLAYVVLYLVAYFSMAGSLRRNLVPYGLPVVIGGVTLFFFNIYYLQGQLRWIARWKATGQTVPKAPKGTLWLLFGVPMFLAIAAIVAAIAIAAYQNYVIRSQVAEGMVMANQAKTAFTGYYASRHAVPADNAAAGLGAMHGHYVSSVTVSDGRITAAFGTVNASRMIRDKVLVLTPTLAAGRITWSCNSETTLPNGALPAVCRR